MLVFVIDNMGNLYNLNESTYLVTNLYPNRSVVNIIRFDELIVNFTN